MSTIKELMQYRSNFGKLVVEIEKKNRKTMEPILELMRIGSKRIKTPVEDIEESMRPTIEYLRSCSTKMKELSKRIYSIQNNNSWSKAISSCGLNGYAGGNAKAFKNIADTFQIDLSHMKGQGWNAGNDALNAIPLDQLLVKGSSARSDNLKKKLIKKGMLEDECYECGQLPIWNGKLLVLELDHIDGDNSNNELVNLRILCGNCHSQTKNFRGRKEK